MAVTENSQLVTLCSNRGYDSMDFVLTRSDLGIAIKECHYTQSKCFYDQVGYKLSLVGLDSFIGFFQALMSAMNDWIEFEKESSRVWNDINGRSLGYEIAFPTRLVKEIGKPSITIDFKTTMSFVSLSLTIDQSCFRLLLDDIQTWSDLK